MDKTNTTTTNGQMAETKEQSRTEQNQSICRCVISGRSDDGVLKTTSKEQFSRNNSRSLLLRFKVLDRRRRKRKKKRPRNSTRNSSSSSKVSSPVHYISVFRVWRVDRKTEKVSKAAAAAAERINGNQDKCPENTTKGKL